MAPRRQLRFISLLLLLLAAFVVPAPSAAAALPVDLTGTLELLHGEDRLSGAATYEYRLPRTAS